MVKDTSGKQKGFTEPLNASHGNIQFQVSPKLRRELDRVRREMGLSWKRLVLYSLVKALDKQAVSKQIEEYLHTMPRQGRPRKEARNG